MTVDENYKVVDIGASGYRTIVKTVDADNKSHVLITGQNNYGQIGIIQQLM